MSSHPNQIGGKTSDVSLSAEVVKTLGDDPQGIINLRAVGAAPLLLAGFAPQAPMSHPLSQPDQSLAVESGHRFHLVQQLAMPLSVGIVPPATF